MIEKLTLLKNVNINLDLISLINKNRNKKN